MPPDDLFERAYLGQPSAWPPRPRSGIDQGAELAARIAPAEALALRGVVLTPDQLLPDGYVVIADGVIVDVTTSRPEQVRVHDTGGVILPGLIDWHGHPEFNVFPSSEPTDAARRSPGRMGRFTAYSATPAANSASDVRIRARNVRSLAMLKRGSGSTPCPQTQYGRRHGSTSTRGR